MSLSSGTRLGPYEILGPLGAGGMGAVYQARDTRLGRRVAIKVLAPEKLASPDRRRCFAHEARAASALNHPNISSRFTTLLRLGELDYIAMEYVPGRTLEALIGCGALGIGATLEYARQAASALSAAHAAGILHCDLKPANIMVTDPGVAKVLDFGLARRAGPRESAGPIPVPPPSPWRAVSSAPLPTCLPSRPKGKTSISAATSSASAPCFTRCSPAAARLTAARRPPRFPRFYAMNLRPLPRSAVISRPISIG